jgi:DNA-directed RNA polymerase specialized sigma24 family protein
MYADQVRKAIPRSEGKAMSPGQIAKVIGAPRATVRQLLIRMFVKGEVQKRQSTLSGQIPLYWRPQP